METTKLVYRNCNNEQSVFDVIDELKFDNLIPQNSTLGNRVTTNNQPENAVGQVTVRQNESFWIVANG
jgi:hypothetical protein